MLQVINTNVAPVTQAELRARYGTQRNPNGIKIPKAKGKPLTPAQLKIYLAGKNLATVPLRAY